MPTPVLTLVTHVYNAQAMVDEQLARWRAFSPALRQRLAFIIVDDCSSSPLTVDASGLNLRLLRVADDIAWNMPGCRNLLAMQAQTDWLLYFDIDNTTAEANIQAMVDALPRMDAKRLHVFRRTEGGVDVEPHINTFLISRRGFFTAGGYDEDFCGHYGFEDVVFRNMWRKHVGDELMFTNIAFEQLGHRTSGLDRDTARNQALAQYKLALGLPKPTGQLRFQWEEVALAGAGAPADPNPAGAGAPEGVALPGTGRRKLVVYTALVGPKEALNNPLALLPEGATTDLDLDFVCLTDDRTLRSDVWRMELLTQAHLPPEKLSRRPKALPHLYFAQATHSLYIDNTVAFKRLPCAADLDTTQPYLFRAFKHARHTQLSQEVHAVAALGYEDANIICQQMDFYAQHLPLTEISPLTTGTVLLRDHSHPVVQAFGQVWFENVLAFAKRDQLAFDFALRQSGAQVDYLPGITRENEFIHWTGSLSPARLRASFDAKRYAWRHRDEPQAVRDPKSHALAHQRGGEAAYQRPLRLLEVMCHQQGSSLGQQVSPRRDVADALEPLLTPWRQQVGARFLVVQVPGLGEAWAQRFEPAEFEAAGLALSNFMGGQAQGTVFELPAADLADLGRIYAAGEAPPNDLLLVLGLPGEALAAGVHKLVRLLNPARGALAFVLASPAPLAQAVEAEAVVQRWLDRPVRAGLQAARHDALDGPLANGLFSLSW